MASEQFANLATTTVVSGGTTAPTAGTVETWTVASSGSFPTLSAGQQFRIVEADSVRQAEIILVTAISGTSWTVTRGVEGTATLAHPSGFTIVQTVTAAEFSKWEAGVQSVAASGNLSSSGGQNPAITLTSGPSFGGISLPADGSAISWANAGGNGKIISSGGRLTISNNAGTAGSAAIVISTATGGIALTTPVGQLVTITNGAFIGGAISVSSTQTTSTVGLFYHIANATSPVLIVKGGATPGVGADLQQWQNNAGTTVTNVDASGNITSVSGLSIIYTYHQDPAFSGSYMILNPSSNAFGAIQVQSRAATTIPMQFRGFTGQTADLSQWTDNSSNILAKVDSTGAFTGINVPMHARATTTTANSNASLVDINGLLLPLVPGTYVFESNGAYTNSAGNVSTRFAVAFSGTQSSILYNLSVANNPNTNSLANASSFSTITAGSAIGPTSSGNTANAVSPYFITGSLVVTATGTLSIQFNVPAGGTTTTAQIGSYLKVTRIA
jgi:hypothetical protein